MVITAIAIISMLWITSLQKHMLPVTENGTKSLYLIMRWTFVYIGIFTNQGICNSPSLGFTW